jgi:hypothetical protein
MYMEDTCRRLPHAAGRGSAAKRDAAVAAASAVKLDEAAAACPAALAALSIGYSRHPDLPEALHAKLAYK